MNEISGHKNLFSLALSLCVCVSLSLSCHEQNNWKCLLALYWIHQNGGKPKEGTKKKNHSKLDMQFLIATQTRKKKFDFFFSPCAQRDDFKKKKKKRR